MRTLVSGKGMPASDNDETTTTTRNFISKGSAVLKNGSGGTGKTADEMFARAWSPVDRYDEYADLQKHSALSKKGRIYDALNISDSVLRENGIVQIGPYKGETIKRFMFSLENLAWSDSLTKLRDCEIGPGDSLTGTKGRIMWFPPYDISINESVSASYDRTNFIGRGEPIYTYNNTERTGTLSWKIVVDHPNYLNFFKDGSNEDYASFFAGALDVKDIRDRILTKEQSDRYEIDSATEREEIVPKWRSTLRAARRRNSIQGSKTKLRYFECDGQFTEIGRCENQACPPLQCYVLRPFHDVATAKATDKTIEEYLAQRGA